VATPQAFFDRLDAEFNFTLDVCALPENAKCKRYFTPEINGLAQPWRGQCCGVDPASETRIIGTVLWRRTDAQEGSACF
jgi:hypothetical protein